jgi:hypothetical protein
MPTWADEVQAYAAAASVVLSTVSVVFVVASLRQASSTLFAQNRSTDVASVITLFDKLDQHWRKFKNAKESSDLDFEFGQLISYYELSSRLFRDKVFQTKAALTLYEHLHDVLTAMRSDDNFKRRFDDLHTHPDNYENIIWLCKQPRRRVQAKKRGLRNFLSKLLPTNLD